VEYFAAFYASSNDQHLIKEKEFKMEYADIIKECKTNEKAVNKQTQVKTEQLAFDTYYFKPSQVLEYHKHPNGDQIFVVLQGEGEFYLDDGEEEIKKIAKGSVFLAPKDVWHKIVNTGNEILIASQSTNQPAGMVVR